MIQTNYVECIARVIRIKKVDYGTCIMYNCIVSIPLPLYRKPKGKLYPYNPHIKLTIPAVKKDINIEEGTILAIIGHIENYRGKIGIRVKKYGFLKPDNKYNKLTVE